MCLNGTWTPVCSDRWGYRTSSVVCRQLGYNGRKFRAVSLISLYDEAYFSLPASYPRVRQRTRLQSFLVAVDCTGDEARLSDCSHRKDSDCYGGTAGVICSSMLRYDTTKSLFYYIPPGGTCDEGTVHLVGSDDVSRGRAIYCHNGTWHSLCRDHWNSAREEARVLCQTLGYDISRYGKPP